MEYRIGARLRENKGFSYRGLNRKISLHSVGKKQSSQSATYVPRIHAGIDTAYLVGTSK